MKNFLPTVLAFCLVLASIQSKAQVPVYSSYPSASATIFLDFDGHKVEGTMWNAFGPIFCEPANLNTAQITEVFNRVAEDYRPFNINITTDSTKYWAAPVFQRVRIIITTSSSWYGNAGGVSYLGSFTWGDNTPAFVFSALLNYNTKRIGEATSHEMGHTLKLRHQSFYDNNCVKTEYHPGVGSGEIGWAPIMGVGYYRNFTLWNHGTNATGCSVYQDDLSIITDTLNGFGYRTDDHASTVADATYAPMVNNQFVTEGVIEKPTDNDVFKFNIPVNGNLRIDATPYNIGTGNSGSNLDIQMDIMDNNYNVISTYNPATQLNLSVDSTFAPGTYYVRVQGKGNVYAPEYASLGSYSITSSFRPLEPLPLHKLELKGTTENKKHKLDWIIEADETVTQQVLEVSAGNNRDFQPLNNLSTSARSFMNTPSQNGWLHYRLHVSFDDGRSYYSNVIVLSNNISNNKPVINGNLVNGSMVVNSSSPFAYTVLDYNGRTVLKGNIVQGMNTIITSSLSSGMYIIRFNNGQEVHNEKFMKQ